MMKMNPELYIPMYGKVATTRPYVRDPEPNYKDTQEWFNEVLNIGVKEDVEESSDDLSVTGLGAQANELQDLVNASRDIVNQIDRGIMLTGAVTRVLLYRQWTERWHPV